MAIKKILAVIANKEQKYRRESRNWQNVQNIVDSDACGSACGGPTSLDNRFAVVHTLHNTTAMLKQRTRKEGIGGIYQWGKIIVVSGEK